MRKLLLVALACAAAAGTPALAQVTSQIVFSYIVNPSGNQTLLALEDTIQFTRTQVGQPSTVTIIVSNRTAAVQNLQTVVLAGDGYRLTGLPLLPATMPINGELRFTITYTAAGLDVAKGRLEINTSAGRARANLEGSGEGAILNLESISGSEEPVPVPNGGTIQMGSLPVGDRSLIRLRFRNIGNTVGRISTISLSGADLALEAVPPLPTTIAAGSVIEFSIVFAPQRAGPTRGFLRVDTFTYEVLGEGLGASLIYRTTIGSAVNTVNSGAALLFPNTPIGRSTEMLFEIVNTGNQPSTIQGITIAAGAFKLEGVPALPLTIGPSLTVAFKIIFVPNAIGSLAALLQLDETRFNARGNGSEPPNPPPVVIQSSSDSPAALSQPTLRVALETPYLVDLTGRITLAFASDSFADDPAIQFSTGARIADFRIPAGSTQGVFGDGSNQVAMQAGTVSGNITASVNLLVSGIVITPNPTIKTLVVRPAAPSLRGVTIDSRSGSSLDLVVSGLSTARKITQLALQITPVPGANLQSTTLQSNVEATFDTWYVSTASRQHGSQFSAVVRLLVNGDANAIQSVSVTATNAQGTSAPVSVSLR